jgi:predicted DNA-binding WGR domain protein
MNTCTLTHTDGRDAVYRLVMEQRDSGFTLFADYGRRDVWTRRAELTVGARSGAVAKKLFDRKIAEKKRRGYRIVAYS